MRKLNISVPMLYKDKHGADKTKWVNIGSLVIQDDGKVYGDISATPTGAWDGSFGCFDKEEKSQQGTSYQTPQQPTYQAPQQPTYQTPPQQAPVQYRNKQGLLTDELGNVLPAHYQ